MLIELYFEYILSIIYQTIHSIFVTICNLHRATFNTEICMSKKKFDSYINKKIVFC